MPAHGTISRPSVVLTPSSQANYNIRTAAGSPAVASDVFVTVGNGIVISGASTTGTGWPANSSITITILAGGIWAGAAGDGGFGASSHTSPGGGGNNGSAGLTISDNVKVYLAIYDTGFLAGGGGGGGGGGASFHFPAEEGGGGGGGGQGYPGGAAGSGGASAQDGVAGSTGSPGGGGNGDGVGGKGGRGGGLAGGGSSGVSAVSAGGAGGAPGAAVYSVGHTAPTFLTIPDAAHVKGAVVT